MVLPHSVLRSGQHLKWRAGSYKRKAGRNAPSIGLNLRVQEPWDLDNVVPDFFPCRPAWYLRSTTAWARAPLAPATVQVWRGNWEEDYAGITQGIGGIASRRWQVQVTLRRTVQPRRGRH